MPDGLYYPYRDGPLRSGTMMANHDCSVASASPRNLRESPLPMVARLQAPIVLAHGLFGFSRIGLGPLTLTTYFRGIPDELRAAGNRVLVTRVHPIAGVEFRARRLGDRILRAFPEEPVHIIGHSMGGLDARRLLADPFWRKRVLSLTTIGTPHLGTYLADFAKLRVGRVYRLLDLMGLDPRGFLDITRRSARRFHRLHDQPLDIPCFSLAGDPPSTEVTWPLQRLHAMLSELEGPNDGLVSVASAQAFGTALPSWPADHLRQMNWMTPMPGSICPHVPDLYAQVLDKLAALGFASAGQNVA
ncbi:MAG TPA: alpha/beta fold hydrolase [Candidatus Methylomirabilis sp.]|nr:alpha/beta fold hydrolase [Candidatus Methylomirabilis sp.]